MTETILDIRGHEIPDPVPFEPSFRVKQPFDMVAYVRSQMMREREEMENTINSEDDLIEDQLDFDGEYFTDGKMPSSPYEIGEEVPDYAPQKVIHESDEVSNLPKDEKANTPELPA